MAKLNTQNKPKQNLPNTNIKNIYISMQILQTKAPKSSEGNPFYETLKFKALANTSTECYQST